MPFFIHYVAFAVAQYEGDICIRAHKQGKFPRFVGWVLGFEFFDFLGMTIKMGIVLFPFRFHRIGW